MNLRFTDSAAQNELSRVYQSNDHPLLKINAVREKVMPDVRGMGLKDAVYLLENMGLKVAVQGKGKIMVQSVAPGSSLAKGVTVVLNLG